MSEADEQRAKALAGQEKVNRALPWFGLLFVAVGIGFLTGRIGHVPSRGWFFVGFGIFNATIYPQLLRPRARRNQP